MWDFKPPEQLAMEAKEQEDASLSVNKNLITRTLKFNDGNVIPQIGLGTFLKSRTVKYYRKKDEELSKEQIEQDKKDDEKEEREFREAVLTAVKGGYRHIDTAQGIIIFLSHYICVYLKTI